MFVVVCTEDGLSIVKCVHADAAGAIVCCAKRQGSCRIQHVPEEHEKDGSVRPTEFTPVQGYTLRQDGSNVLETDASAELRRQNHEEFVEMMRKKRAARPK